MDLGDQLEVSTWRNHETWIKAVAKEKEKKKFFFFKWASLVAQIKAPAWNVGDPGSIPELGRSPGEGNGNPLQYSCLENLMEGGAW